jgi:putative colanic acid biosynthesis acetyltransferase WcaF
MGYTQRLQSRIERNTMPAETRKYIDLHLAALNTPREIDGRQFKKMKLWHVVQNWLFRLAPRANFMWWRRLLLRLFGAEIGDKVQISPSVKITCPWNVTIGDHVWIGDGVELYGRGKFEIAEDVVISQHAYLCTGTHNYTRLDFPRILKPIRVEKEAWIATRSFIAPGVTIGQGAIVGAQSVVLHDIPPATIYAGNPAIFLKERPYPTPPSPEHKDAMYMPGYMQCLQSLTEEISMHADTKKYLDLHFAATNASRENDGLQTIKIRLWPAVQKWLFRPSPLANFMWWRRLLLRLFGAKIGDKVQISPSIKITCPWNITIGDRTWIGDCVELYDRGKIDIAEDVVISQHVYLCTGTHDYTRLDFQHIVKPIRIEKEAWIATRSYVAPGVTIGQGAIVGAQSVVLQDIPPATIYAGNPAVFLKERPCPDTPEKSQANTASLCS